MAFVARLPKRDMYLQEGHYGSKLHLRLNPDTQCCDGTYEPASIEDLQIVDMDSAELPNAVDLEADRPPPGTPGHAILFGRIKPEPGSNGFVLKGEWRHVQGPLHGGSFEMKLDSEGKACGWWAKDGENEQMDWQWAPHSSEKAGLLKDGDSDDEHVIQSSASMRPRLRPSMSARSDRSKTFYDEMLAAEGTSSVWIARWGVLCAWIFFYQTLAALAMSSLEVSGTATYVVQLVFQGVYTATYTSFLVVYSRMRVMPPWDYVLGVVLYTLGYTCFVALYAFVLIIDDEEDAARASQGFYLAGSLLFLSGSAVLVRATVPPPIPMMLRELSFIEDVRARFSVIDQQSSLFWGSMAFLLGSFLFCLDAGWGLHAASKPGSLSAFSIITGYALFTIGRLYFLWGSTTADCDALFGGQGLLYNWFAAFRSSKDQNFVERKCIPSPSLEESLDSCVPVELA